jgi:hypothetical protein
MEKRKGKNAWLRGRPTYNMPEKHQQFARPNNPENMIGTVRSVSMMMESPFHPSLPLLQ